MIPETSQQADQQALNLSRSIALQESSSNGKTPNYNAVGDAGTSKGAYQWQPGNFEAAAKKYGLDPSDFSPVNQDKVAYAQVKDYKDKGYQPAEIASLWNSGSPDNWQDHKGTTVINGKTISYDTPTYVNKVKSYYQKLSGSQQSGYNPTPYSSGDVITKPTTSISDTTQPQEQGLVQQLSQRATDASKALSDTATGKINPLSGILQTVGAGAGAVGDVVGKGLEMIPGVKQLENLLGQGIGSLAQTPVGQSVVKSISDFSNQNPELAKDIGAGFNIITAIPILRGLGMVGKLGLEAGSQALKSVAEKSFIEGAPDLFTTAKSKLFLQRNPNVLKDMVDRRLVGDIQGEKYVVDKSVNSSFKTVEDLNNKVKTILDQPQYSKVSQDGNSIAQKAIDGFTDRNGKVIEGIPQSGMNPSELIDNAKKLDPTNKLLWDKFEAGQANLKEINELRSSLDGKVKKVFIGSAGLDAPEVATSKELGALLSGSMRDAVQSTAQETQQFFKEMSTQFDIQKALGFMNGKGVKPGNVAKVAGEVIGAGTGGLVGGLVGGGSGVMVGGLAGERMAGLVSRKLAGRNLIQGILKRTGKNAVRQTTPQVIRGTAGLIGGSLLQKKNR